MRDAGVSLAKGHGKGARVSLASRGRLNAPRTVRCDAVAEVRVWASRPHSPVHGIWGGGARNERAEPNQVALHRRGSEAGGGSHGASRQGVLLRVLDYPFPTFSKIFEEICTAASQKKMQENVRNLPVSDLCVPYGRVPQDGAGR
jgi:hypothetical protein